MKNKSGSEESIEECLHRLKTSLHGLSSIDAHERLKANGKNELVVGKKKGHFKKVLNQFNNVLIYILLIAAVITGLLQYWIDSSVIMAVVILNALIGYVLETKAEKSISALKKHLSHTAVVIREEKRTSIDARELVLGDVVLLRAGNKVPADIRLININNLQIDESILTGESISADKVVQSINDKATSSTQDIIAYSGTLVTNGMGNGVVIATGEDTEIGRISSLLSGYQRFSTPLLRQLASFSYWLAAIILSFSGIIFLFGVFVRDYPFDEVFMAAVAIAVSVIPEGLPAIITIILAIGVTHMAKRHAIVRRLASVETLSSVTVICTDKTGTLTKNELTVQKILTSAEHYDVTGSGYNDEGKIVQNGLLADVTIDEDLLLLIRAGVLCNEAELRKEQDQWHLIDNPMDGALLALGLKAGLTRSETSKQYPRRAVIPFDSKYKYMASLHHDTNGSSYIFIKGAPEMIFSKCSFQLNKQNEETLNKNYWMDKTTELAKEGMRLLALAYRKTENKSDKLSFKEVEKDLTLIGVVGIMDSPREEVREAILACQHAGVQVKMVTGDHQLTAQAIAKKVGIQGGQVLSGENIDVMSDEKLAEIVEDINVFSRTVPAHKIRLIKALRSRGHIVAMTGDGVNDAPALKNSNIGIAMGIKGTEVTKEASEIILADDNFTSIKHGLVESRNVYNNLKKALLFILPNGGGEGALIFCAILFGYTLPITPVQILWVNMVTAITLALAFAFEPPEKNLMEKKPRKPNEPLLSKFLIWRICFVSFLFVCSMFLLFVYEIKLGADISVARTMMVNLLVFFEAAYLINCRRIFDSTLNLNGIFGSKPALIAIAVVAVLQLGFTYLPFMQYFFKTQALGWAQWLIILCIVVCVFLIVECEKAVIRLFFNNRQLGLNK